VKREGRWGKKREDGSLACEVPGIRTFLGRKCETLSAKGKKKKAFGATITTVPAGRLVRNWLLKI